MFFNFIFHSNTRISRKSFEYCYFVISREMPHSHGKWCSTSARLQQATGWNTVRYQSSEMRPALPGFTLRARQSCYGR